MHSHGHVFSMPFLRFVNGTQYVRLATTLVPPISIQFSLIQCCTGPVRSIIRRAFIIFDNTMQQVAIIFLILRLHHSQWPVSSKIVCSRNSSGTTHNSAVNISLSIFTVGTIFKQHKYSATKTSQKFRRLAAADLSFATAHNFLCVYKSQHTTRLVIWNL